MLHAAHPTDLSGLLRFAARAVPNLAYPLRRLGEEQKAVWTPRALLAPFVPHRGTLHLLLLTQGRYAGALASLRGHRSFSTWELDHLLLASDYADTCIELLARLDALLLQVHGERVFLRLAEGSPALEAAREAGYRPYLAERLYLLSQPNPARVSLALPTGIDVRLRRREDDYPLFRLYGTAMPVSVRSAEGLTFREWQEMSAVRWQVGAQVRDLVALRGGSMVAWCRMASAASGRMVMTILVHPQEPGAASSLIGAALQDVPRGRTVIMAPEHAPSLPDVFRAAGFAPGEAYVSLVHQIGTRVTEPAFMPARV